MEKQESKLMADAGYLSRRTFPCKAQKRLVDKGLVVRHSMSVDPFKRFDPCSVKGTYRQ
jgi:hypothetical protein